MIIVNNMLVFKYPLKSLLKLIFTLVAKKRNFGTFILLQLKAFSDLLMYILQTFIINSIKETCFSSVHLSVSLIEHLYTDFDEIFRK